MNGRARNLVLYEQASAARPRGCSQGEGLTLRTRFKPTIITSRERSRASVRLTALDVP